MAHSRQTRGLLAITMLAGAVLLGVYAAPAQAGLRHIDGTVLSKDAGTRTFRITTQSGSRVRIRVNGSTQFQRIQGGFRGLHKGLRIEVEAKKTSNGLLAKHVEPRQSGGGGGAEGGGGGGGGGADDGPNHR
jgi:hypothetical protein